MRVPLVAGNWKMNMTTTHGVALVEGILHRLEARPDVDVVVCPPFTAMAAVLGIVRNTHVKLGAQSMFWLESGAYTGQISPAMLVDLRAEYVIVGHSETRGRFGAASDDLKAALPYFSETDATINRKLKAALFHSISPILCVGETLAERDAGKTDETVRAQIKGALDGIDAAEIYGIVVAYEPVWAIGTGRVCEDAEANRVCGVVRAAVGEVADAEAADSARVLYGGSVKGSNAAALLRQPDIDGVLVGGASLDAEEFVQIVYSVHP
jgi:triosephosphate isomerase (TIM)